MRAYGLPRNICVEFPDCADMHEFALPGRDGNLPGKNGEDIHSFTRSAASKAATRRVYKRRARAENKALCIIDDSV